MALPLQWPIGHSYETVKQATGWVEVGPACVPWYGGFAEKNAANEIALLISVAPELKQALKAMLKAYAPQADWSRPEELHSAVRGAIEVLGHLEKAEP